MLNTVFTVSTKKEGSLYPNSIILPDPPTAFIMPKVTAHTIISENITQEIAQTQETLEGDIAEYATTINVSFEILSPLVQTIEKTLLDSLLVSASRGVGAGRKPPMSIVRGNMVDYRNTLEEWRKEKRLLDVSLYDNYFKRYFISKLSIKNSGDTPSAQMLSVDATLTNVAATLTGTKKVYLNSNKTGLEGSVIEPRI